MIGWFGSDLVDTVTGAAGSVVDSLESFASNIPGAPAIAKLVTGPVRDFANTAVGRVVFSAIATSLTGGLAPILGPQLATVAWAFPGLARGQDFVTSWTQELASRASQTGAILGAPAVGDTIGAAITSTTDYLTTNGIDVAVYGLDDLTGKAMQRLTKDVTDAGGKGMDIASAQILDYARGVLVDGLRQFNPVTGKWEAPVAAATFNATVNVGVGKAQEIAKQALLTSAIASNASITPGVAAAIRAAAGSAPAAVSAVAPVSASPTRENQAAWDIALGALVIGAAGALWWYSRKA